MKKQDDLNFQAGIVNQVFCLTSSRLHLILVHIAPGRERLGLRMENGIPPWEALDIFL